MRKLPRGAGGTPFIYRFNYTRVAVEWLGMSWFDSSFSFAKTAFSQAQKSIDKALDISEEQGLVPELNYEQTRPPATTSKQS